MKKTLELKAKLEKVRDYFKTNLEAKEKVDIGANITSDTIHTSHNIEFLTGELNISFKSANKRIEVFNCINNILCEIESEIKINISEIKVTVWKGIYSFTLKIEEAKENAR